MAQILVVNENFCWYQAIAALDNYYETDIENRILKHSEIAFLGYYSLKGKFTFRNSSGVTSTSDLLLISKDFSKWIIVEIELVSKSLTHTKMQLGVFTDARFDVNALIAYCQNQRIELSGMDSKLTQLFTDKAPEVLVIFDSYHKTKLGTLKSLFPQIQICVFEVYKTLSHDFESYRLSGDYPYIKLGYCFLKMTSSFDIYEIQRPDLLDSILPGRFEVLYKMTKYNTILMNTKNKYFLKIPNNPFTPSTPLLLYKTIDNTFLIDTVN